MLVTVSRNRLTHVSRTCTIILALFVWMEVAGTFLIRKLFCGYNESVNLHRGDEREGAGGGEGG